MLLHYTVQGTGKPIVLVHGFVSSSRYWKDVAPTLTKHHTVISIDLLGFGKSPKPRRSTYSLASHTNALAETLEFILGNNKPAIIVGHSMGAVIASQLSLQAPHLVKELMLFNMPIFLNATEARETYQQPGILRKILLYTPTGRILWPILNFAATTPLAYMTRPSERVAFRASSGNSHASRSGSLTNTLEATNGIQLLKTLIAPTHFVRGKFDRAVYHVNIDAADLPDTIKLQWAETGHHTPTNAPYILSRLLGISDL